MESGIYFSTRKQIVSRNGKLPNAGHSCSYGNSISRDDKFYYSRETILFRLGIQFRLARGKYVSPPPSRPLFFFEVKGLIRDHLRSSYFGFHIGKKGRERIGEWFFIEMEATVQNPFISTSLL